MKKRYMAIILVLALLLSACGTTIVPAEPTAAEIFREKADHAAQLESYHRELEIKAEKTVGIFEYEEETDITEDFANRSADLIAKVETRDSINNESYKVKEQYLDGKLYINANKTEYVAEVTQEEYLQAQYPLVLVDPANYETVTYDEVNGTFQFQNATALESWMVPEYAKLLSAEGTAKLDSAGSILKTTYTASYIQGPMTVEVTYISSIEETTLTAEDISVAEDAQTVSHMYIPAILARTAAALELEAPLSTQSSTLYMSQALGLYYSRNAGCDLYEKEDTQLIKISESTLVQSVEDSVESEMETVYRDGKITVTMDGESQELENGDFDDFKEVALGDVKVSLADDMVDPELTLVGDYWLLEHKLPEEEAEIPVDYIVEMLTGDPDILDAYVEAVRIDSFGGWVSVDADTLLPVSVGVSLELVQVVRGEEYITTYESVRNMEFGDPDAYEAVMEKPFPDEEPEEKPTPAFYEVTDDKGGRMYLLGTIHIGDDATAYLPDDITGALKASDALALEVNVDSIEERLETDEKLLESYQQGIIYTDGTRTADKLDEDTAKKLDQMIKAYGKQPNMEYYLPSVLGSYFSYAAVDSANGLYTSKGVEYRLLEVAEKENIEVIEVEDVYENLSMDSRYSEATHKYILESGLETYRAWEMENAWELYRVWCLGDETLLREMLNAEDEEALAEATEEELAAYEEYTQIMVTQRDAQMIEKAKEYIASGKTVFMAVGAAHVLGEGGIVDALREAGYTVTKVEY